MKIWKIKTIYFVKWKRRKNKILKENSWIGQFLWSELNNNKNCIKNVDTWRWRHGTWSGGD